MADADQMDPRRASPTRDQRITVAVKDKDEAVWFSIKRTTRLRKLMQDFAKRRGSELHKLQFRFHELQIQERHTPRSLGMHDGDVIEVVPARPKPRESKTRAALGGIFAAAGNGGEERVDLFGARRELAHVLPVDALTGYHGIFVHMRDMAASRAANGRVAAQSLAQKLLRSVQYRDSIPVSRGLLEEMAEGLARDFAGSMAAAAAAAAAAMRRTDGAGATELQARGDARAPHGGPATVDVVVADEADATSAADRQPSAQDYQLRMMCTMCAALSHSSDGGDAMRQDMLADLMHMFRDLIEDLKVAQARPRRLTVLTGPRDVQAGAPLQFSPMDNTTYDARCVHGEVTFVQSVPGEAKPAQVRWASGYQQYVRWEDLTYLPANAPDGIEGFPDRTVDEWQRLLGRLASHGAPEAEILKSHLSSARLLHVCKDTYKDTHKDTYKDTYKDTCCQTPTKTRLARA